MLLLRGSRPFYIGFVCKSCRKTYGSQHSIVGGVTTVITGTKSCRGSQADIASVDRVFEQRGSVDLVSALLGWAGHGTREERCVASRCLNVALVVMALQGVVGSLEDDRVGHSVLHGLVTPQRRLGCLSQRSASPRHLNGGLHDVLEKQVGHPPSVRYERCLQLSLMQI